MGIDAVLFYHTLPSMFYGLMGEKEQLLGMYLFSVNNLHLQEKHTEA